MSHRINHLLDWGCGDKTAEAETIRNDTAIHVTLPAKMILVNFFSQLQLNFEHSVKRMQMTLHDFLPVLTKTRVSLRERVHLFMCESTRPDTTT